MAESGNSKKSKHLDFMTIWYLSQLLNSVIVRGKAVISNMKTNGTNGYGYALIRLFTKTVDRLDLAHEPQFAHT